MLASIAYVARNMQCHVLSIILLAPESHGDTMVCYASVLLKLTLCPVYK